MPSIILPGLAHAGEYRFHDFSGMYRRGDVGIAAVGGIDGSEHVTRFRVAVVAVALNNLEEIRAARLTANGQYHWGREGDTPRRFRPRTRWSKGRFRAGCPLSWRRRQDPGGAKHDNDILLGWPAPPRVRGSVVLKCQDRQCATCQPIDHGTIRCCSAPGLTTLPAGLAPILCVRLIRRPCRRVQPTPLAGWDRW